MREPTLPGSGRAARGSLSAYRGRRGAPPHAPRARVLGSPQLGPGCALPPKTKSSPRPPLGRHHLLPLLPGWRPARGAGPGAHSPRALRSGAETAPPGRAMKVEFAPLNIPLARRLQTAAVLQWVLSFLLLGKVPRRAPGCARSRRDSPVPGAASAPSTTVLGQGRAGLDPGALFPPASQTAQVTEGVWGSLGTLLWDFSLSARTVSRVTACQLDYPCPHELKKHFFFF